MGGPGASPGPPGPVVRDARPSDAAACAAVYAPYVTGTATTFELVAPTTAQVAARIAAAQRGHAWLVLEDGGRVVGFASAHAYAERAAYRWTCESSVYLEEGRRRTGGGRLVYRALLERLADRGFRQVVAGVALPNEASAGLHEALGFRLVGVLVRVGHKHGAWRDVARYQLDLAPGADPAAPPDPLR